MKHTLAAAAAAALALGGIVTAAPAVAAPCLFQGDWNCTGQPQYNGPLQNTWSHGLTTMPQICPAVTRCSPARSTCRSHE